MSFGRGVSRWCCTAAQLVEVDYSDAQFNSTLDSVAFGQEQVACRGALCEVGSAGGIP